MLMLGMSCGQTQQHMHSDDHDHIHGTETGETPAHQGKEYISAYICPMHCEGSGSDQPGPCPGCGMDYQQNDTQNIKGLQASLLQTVHFQQSTTLGA